MVNTLRGMPKAERKNTEVVIYGAAYRERARADAKAEIAAKGSTKMTENSYLERFKADARFLGAKVTIAESAQDVVKTMGKAADGEIKKVIYFGHSGPLHDGKWLALDYHSNGSTDFGKENVTANDMATIGNKFATGGKVEHRGCHGGFPGGFCQELSKQVPQIETERAKLRSDYSQIYKSSSPNLSKVIPEGSAEKGVTKNEWGKYEKGERKTP